MQKKIGKNLHNLENILDLYKIPQNALKTPIFQLRLVISVVFFPYTYSDYYGAITKNM